MSAKNSPGKHIAELCNTYGVTQETLSERSGVPIDLIRKIVDEDLIPDLAPLIKIARSLGVRLGTLLDDHEQLGPVITRAGTAGDTARFITGLPEGNQGLPQGDKEPAGDDHKGLTFKALAPDKSSRHMEPFIVDIEPDAEQKMSTHEGEEFIYVISGKLAMEYGTHSDVLNEGDSVYYDSIVPHRVFSSDSKPVRILAVIYTPA